jgi:choline kinase
MLAVMLAAGQGTRLGSIIPKCLIELRGKTLLERHLNALRSVGIDNCLIVIGNGGVWSVAQQNCLRNFANDYGFEILVNQRSIGTHSTASLALAITRVDTDVVVMDGDIVYSEQILHSLVKQERTTVLVTESELQTGSKVLARAMYDPPRLLLQSIGENLNSKYVYAGMMKICKRDLSAFREKLTSGVFDTRIMADLLDNISKEREMACLLVLSNPGDLMVEEVSEEQLRCVVTGKVFNMNTMQDYIRAEALLES